MTVTSVALQKFEIQCCKVRCWLILLANVASPIKVSHKILAMQVETQNHKTVLVGRDLKDHWAWTPFTRPG